MMIGMRAVAACMRFVADCRMSAHMSTAKRTCSSCFFTMGARPEPPPRTKASSSSIAPAAARFFLSDMIYESY